VGERSERGGLVHCTNEVGFTSPPNAERCLLRSRRSHTTGPTHVERQKIQLIVACELGSTARRKPKTKQKSSTKIFVYTYISILSFTYSLVTNKTTHPTFRFCAPFNPHYPGCTFPLTRQNQSPQTAPQRHSIVIKPPSRLFHPLQTARTQPSAPHRARFTGATLDTAPNSCYKRPDPLRTQD
jgi:hypothetical protein